jgi:hypothetical protein
MNKKVQENTENAKCKYDYEYLYKNECEINNKLMRENEELKTALFAINQITNIKLH